MTPETAAQPSFRAHYEEAFLRLAGALTELILSAGGDPTRPQEISRSFDLDKTLSWKLSKLTQAEDPFVSLRYVPGASGLDILARKLGEAGATSEHLEAVRAARAAFDSMIEVQAGDRATLELMLESMAPEPIRTPRLEASRKLSFQGNSATWGVQARTRYSVHIVAPNADDPQVVDLGNIGGFLDLRRLRPTAWPLVHLQAFGAAESLDDLDPIDPSAEPGTFVVKDFCSSPLPDIRTHVDDSGILYELAEGPVGHPQAVSCALGWWRRKFGAAFAEDGEGTAEHILKLDTPVEEIVFDVFIHADLPFPSPPTAALYSLMEGRPQYPFASQRRYRLDLPIEVKRLGSRPPVITTAEVPRYPELLDMATKSMGTSLDEFVGYRVRLRYPPIPTFCVMSYPLVGGG